MLRFKSIFLVLFAFGVYAKAQTVSIDCDSFVCLNEVMTFKSTISGGTATAYSWNFGDGSTSTQANPGHAFSIYGSKKLTLQVTFSGGATINAAKTIMVHDVPSAKFSLGNSNFCLHNQKVCLTDSSTMGATTNGYASRLILWGDGSQSSSSSPLAQKNICFAQYPNISTYTLVAEVVNNKGCENKWQQTITILDDYVPSFRANVSAAECNKQKVCFVNDSSTPPANIKTWEWDYIDGTTEKGNWTGNCHYFTTSQFQYTKFSVELNNGCKSEVAKQFKISFPKVETNIWFGDTINCYPQAFQFANPQVAGASYYWELYDSDTVLINISGYNLVQNIIVPKPDDYFVRLRLTLGNCTEYSRYVKISSRGVLPDFLALNNNQCSLKDTVFFLNTSIKHPLAIPEWSWNFDDTLAPNCIGYPNNCNYDSLLNSRHWYSDTGCYYPSLHVIDRYSGCGDSTTKKVSFISPDFAVFSAELRRPCIGIKSDYGVVFTDNLCGGDIRICIDSLADDNQFDMLRSIHYYPGVKDPNGWVTVGFEITTGSNKVYRSADTSDYYYTSQGICKDTIWYHNWFRLFKEPIFDFEIKKNTQCLPILATAVYNGGQDSAIDFIKYLWEPNNSITTFKIVNDSIPELKHIYKQEGRYDVYLHLEDTNGCYEYGYYALQFGYVNVFNNDSIVCVGNEIEFKDSIRYWEDPTAYWRYANVPEKMWWDFGDGNAFVDTNFNPKHTYATKGNYLVRLATQDANGCTDTTENWIEVAGITADIGDKNKLYLCDQIIQFFDSSYFDDTATRDKIAEYFWDFGDFTTFSYLEDPFHYYTSNGEFTLTHAIKSVAGCVDTATFQIYLKGPEPYFDITSDTVGCVPFTASFKSTSNNVNSLIWYMGDNNNTTISAPRDSAFSFTYTEPGTYYIYLGGSDSFYNEDVGNKYTCSALFPDTNRRVYETRRVIVLPIPQVDFDYQGPICVGQNVEFTSKSDSIYDKFNWNVQGFDTVSLTKRLTYNFKAAGTYEIKHLPKYLPTGPYQRACFDTASMQVEVSYVKSGFKELQQGICNEFQFTSLAENAIEFVWDFGHPQSGDKNTSNLPNPSHLYGQDSGIFTVCLVARNAEQCSDTSCIDILSSYFKELVLYNVFTPAGDNLNDNFKLKVENTSFFYIQIFNRWGEQVFHSTDPNFSWDGTDLKTGKILPSSTYFYIINYQFNCESEPQIAEGIIDLIREN